MSTNPLDTARAVAAACRSLANDCESGACVALGGAWHAALPCALREVSRRAAVPPVTFGKGPLAGTTRPRYPTAPLSDLLESLTGRSLYTEYMPGEDRWGILAAENEVIAANDAANHDLDRPRAVIAPLRVLASRIDSFIRDMEALQAEERS